MNKLKMQTQNFTDENIEKLANLFPNCVTESKDNSGKLKKSIDFDLLKQELSENIVDGPRERYQLNWPGKKEALLNANTPIDKTLRPCREESVNFDTTENLYIEGDNLDALKLLQESYLGKIKMIYIDPPYNTGKDFVYNDNFTRSQEEELASSGQIDEIGGRLIANLESNGRFHSDWMNMIYPRIKLAKNLLKDDGIIFISIDDNEVKNLKSLCDEIFGEDNFVEQIVWKNKYGAGAKTVGFIGVHEYILCYSKNRLVNIESLLDENSKKAYNKKDSKFQERGGYFTQPLMTSSMDDRPNLQYSITYNEYVIKPSKQWVWSEKRLKNAIENDEVVFNQKTDGSYSVRSKQYLKDVNGNERKGKPISLLNGPFTQEGTSDISKLFERPVFGFPKPTSLIENFLAYRINEIDDNEGLYLDFFSGSATMAHAVMNLNNKDNGKRKYICIQIPEKTPEKSEAYKSGYKTIPEIGKERIRRAGNKIKEENANKEGIEDLDIGFRVLKIDSSNMKDVYYTPDQMSQSLLDLQEENIKDDRTAEDLLFQIMLDWGIDLTLPITRKEIKSKTVYSVDGDTLIACFDDNLDSEFAKEIAKLKPLRAVFKESGYKLDEDKINIDQVILQFSPDTEVRAI